MRSIFQRCVFAARACEARVIPLRAVWRDYSTILVENCRGSVDRALIRGFSTTLGTGVGGLALNERGHESRSGSGAKKGGLP